MTWLARVPVVAFVVAATVVSGSAAVSARPARAGDACELLTTAQVRPLVSALPLPQKPLMMPQGSDSPGETYCHWRGPFQGGLYAYVVATLDRQLSPQDRSNFDASFKRCATNPIRSEVWQHGWLHESCRVLTRKELGGIGDRGMVRREEDSYGLHEVYAGAEKGSSKFSFIVTLVQRSGSTAVLPEVPLAAVLDVMRKASKQV